MGLEKVKEKVMEEARLKAKAKVDSATLESRNILKSFSAQAKEKEKVFMEKLATEVEFIKKREAASAKLESKKFSLSFKKEFIDKMFDIVSEKLANLPEGTRAKHIKKLLEKASDELKVGTVYCNKKDLSLLKGRKTKTVEIIGGIMAESPDGELRVDYSYETLLRQIKESLMPELNQILFDKK